MIDEATVCNDVYLRFKEICPANKIVDMTSDEVDKAVKIAFEIIGYNPNNLSSALEVANANSLATWLYEYIYDVWRYDV